MGKYITRAEHIARVRKGKPRPRLWEKPLHAPWLKELDPESKLAHWIGIQINRFTRGDWGDTPGGQAFKNNIHRHRNTDNYSAQYKMSNGQYLRIAQGRYTGLHVWIGLEMEDAIPHHRDIRQTQDQPHHIYYDDGDQDFYY